MKSDGYKTCIHCGTPFSKTARKDSSFCCNGCEYVYGLIRKEGLDHYYDLRDKRIQPVQPAALHPRDYTWLETAAAEVESASSKMAEMILELEGISCVGCVWLIEKVFRQHPGAVFPPELQFGDGLPDQIGIRRDDHLDDAGVHRAQELGERVDVGLHLQAVRLGILLDLSPGPHDGKFGPDPDPGGAARGRSPRGRLVRCSGSSS